ncbi:MAG: metallophosphoesterase [Myxococcota bacterium]
MVSAPAEAEPTSAPAAAAPGNPCFAPFATGAEEKMTVAGVPFVKSGTVLKMEEDANATTVLGVIGNVKEFSDENAAAITDYVGFFKERKVDAVVVTGDVGESQSDIEMALTAIAKVGKPIFAVIGNRENGDDFGKAVAKVDGVVDLNQTRLVILDDHALVSVPGYHDPNYVHAERGCVYGPAEIAEIGKAVDAAGDVPVVVVSHGPPKQSGEAGIDMMAEGDHVGNAALTAFAEAKKVPFMIASNIQESGGRGSSRDGSKPVAEKEMASELYFNPGGADRTVAWKMRNGEFAYGMVGIMSLDGDKASYELMKLPNPEM